MARGVADGEGGGPILAMWGVDGYSGVRMVFWEVESV